MYQRYWQLSSNPFAAEASERCYFASRSNQSAVLKLNYLVDQRRGVGVLAGVAGVGKTFLLTLLQSRSRSRATLIHLPFPQLSAEALLGYLASELEEACAVDAENQASPLDSGQTIDQLLRGLVRQFQQLTAQQRPPVIVIDDAQFIEDSRVYQTLQLLMNLGLRPDCELSLILCGQPEFLGMLPQMHRFDDRVSLQAIVHPLTEAETADYVRFRLQAAGANREIFEPAALSALFELSEGNPRRINRLCDFALLVGFSEGARMITPALLQGVAEEFAWNKVA